MTSRVVLRPGNSRLVRTSRRSQLPRRTPVSTPTAAVLGAGHGGLALAAYLAASRVAVNLWNRSPGPIAAIRGRGGILLTGGAAGERFVLPQRVTNEMDEAVAGAEVVLVALPASAHADVAWAVAPFLRDGQMILLLPGRTGGALEFRRVLLEAGCTAQVVVGEAQSFPFASRVVGPGAAAIYRVKRELPVAALPAARTPELVAAVRPLLPMVVPAPSVLTTSFENMGAVLHPGISLLNAGRIESPDDFLFYCEGVTSSVAHFLEALDSERVAVARAYGVTARTLPQWLHDAYGVGGDELRDIIVNNQAYAGITAPDTLDHRYIHEDVPTGLVPLVALARVAGVPVPATEAAIGLANAIHRCDYRQTGRTLERQGLSGMTAEAIREYAMRGGTGPCASE